MLREAFIFSEHQCFTVVHNAVFDTLMRELSNNAFTVLLLIVRQTTGWERDEAGLSYSDIQYGTGIKSTTTVARAVQELLNYGYDEKDEATRRPLIEVVPGTQHQSSRYKVKRDAKVEWEPLKLGTTGGSSPLKNGVLEESSPLKNGVLSALENGVLDGSSPLKNKGINRKEERSSKKKEKNKDLAPSRRERVVVSPHHNHPAVNAYREILEYPTITGHQASLIAQISEIDEERSAVAWRRFLIEVAEQGFQQKFNVKVVVLAFKQWRRGIPYREAFNLAWREASGEEGTVVVRSGKLPASTTMIGNMDPDDFGRLCAAEAARNKNAVTIEVEV